MMTTVKTLIGRPWIWSWIAAAASFALIMGLTQGRGAGELAYAALSFGAFTAIVGLGQMMVITLGPGNVDLSIPATMTLSRYAGAEGDGVGSGHRSLGPGHCRRCRLRRGASRTSR